MDDYNAKQREAIGLLGMDEAKKMGLLEPGRLGEDVEVVVSGAPKREEVLERLSKVRMRCRIAGRDSDCDDIGAAISYLEGLGFFGYGIVGREGHAWWGDEEEIVANVSDSSRSLQDELYDLNNPAESYLTAQTVARRPYRIVRLLAER